jgi:hypothetical protein
MKDVIFYELLQKFKHNLNFAKKVKIFAFVGVIGFVITSGLAIWAGISALNFVAANSQTAVNFVTTNTQKIVQTSVTQDDFQKLKNEVQSVTQFQPLSCWGKAQTLLSAVPWLERSALDNLVNLKVACFGGGSNICEGVNCQEIKELMNNQQGGTI